MINKQNTAVNRFYTELLKSGNSNDYEVLFEIYKHFLEIEKEHLEEAWKNGFDNFHNYFNFEDYYNQNYNQ
jgi:hypothetical protein